ncbi:MAG: lytic murein transglycosylase B [Gammaproteobacteria bacterium]
MGLRIAIATPDFSCVTKTVTVYWVVFSMLLSGCGYASSSLTRRADVKAFVDRMVAVHQFDREALLALFKKVRIQDGIIRAMTRPAESKPWYLYRGLFVTERQISGGLEFWLANAASLAEAEQEYGVPAEIIVAIIGVETRYGENAGTYRVVDALSTLAFDYPRRSEFFSGELEEFLVLCREEKINPLEPVGSYAGAMGIPQFMPSSYRKFAMDQDHDGRRDIWKSNRDAIASVANYFSKHGWVRGASVTFPALIQGGAQLEVPSKGLKLDTTVGHLQDTGVSIPPGIDPDQEAKLLKLDNEYGPGYWVTLPNFFVITRYNHSALYAMAVYQLSREILHRKQTRS